MVTKKEALEGDMLSLAYKVEDEEYTILRLDPHHDYNSEGVMTLITSGTISIEAETLGDIVDQWGEVDKPSPYVKAKNAKHRISETEYENITIMLEEYVERYGEDATANDIVIHERT
jgi:hypothetical protein